MRASSSTQPTNAERRSQSDTERLVRRRKIITWIVVSVVLCAVTSFSSGIRTGGYDRRPIPDAVRSATTPLSSYENSLVNTPNPVDNSSDLAVTGNVTGGKHFRGGLPYRSPTSIDAPLGSTSIDSFMRRTTPSSAGGAAGVTSGPYYSQTGTVTGGRLDQSLGTTYTKESSPSGYTPGTGLRLAPADDMPSDIPMVSPATPGSELQAGRQTSTQFGGRVTREEYDRQMVQLQERLAEVKAEVAQLERSFAGEQEFPESVPQNGQPAQPPLPAGVAQTGPRLTAADAARRQELLQETARLLSAAQGLSDATSQAGDGGLGETSAGTATDTRPRLQLYEEQPQGQVERAPEGPLSIDALISPRLCGPRVPSPAANPNERPSAQRVNETARALERPTVPGNPPSGYTPVSRMPRGEELPSGYRMLGRKTDSTLSPIDAATLRAAQSRQAATDRTPASLPGRTDTSSAQAFDRYLQAGQSLMQRGDYYRAAEAFTLAAGYRPNDARAYLGKGQALLATGQYLNSALFIAKAVELNLPAALQRTDLIQLLGGPDAFVTHFDELDKLIKVQGTPELRFLMAYIYYQMDRPQDAKSAIDAAQKQAPASISIDLLRNAIYR